MLYQEYRPQSFEDMIGNQSQLLSLKRTLEKENRPHVYLFVGPPGCGKTTAARIAAKEIGAAEIAISEINSADNRGIDTARDIRDKMRFLPIEGKASVFIIDELHMTTKEWQTAMLKPLEDTPAHVYFFLCTTDPQKLSKPFLSRCTEFKFSPLRPEELSLLIRKTAKNEGVKLDKEIIQEIAQRADGCPRKALVLLEKVLPLEDPKDQISLLECGGGEEEEAEAIELCRLLIKSSKQDWGKLAGIVSRLDKDKLEGVRQSVMGYMGAILDKNFNPKAMMILEVFAERDFFYDAKARLKVAIARVLFPE